MANTQSAIKAARKPVRLTLRNKAVKTRIKTLHKAFEAAAKAGDAAKAKTAGIAYVSAMGKAVKSGSFIGTPRRARNRTRRSTCSRSDLDFGMAACHPEVENPHRRRTVSFAFRRRRMARCRASLAGGRARPPGADDRRRAHPRANAGAQAEVLEEGVALLGVEFLTPALARRKRGLPPGIGKSLQLLVLRSRIAAKLSVLGATTRHEASGRSLESDLSPPWRTLRTSCAGVLARIISPLPSSARYLTR